MPEEIRVLIADGHDVFRSGLRALLEWEGIHVIGEASTGEEAVERSLQLAPSVVVMDVAIPGMDGYEATRRIAASDSTRVLLLSLFSGMECCKPAAEAGAYGCLTKMNADRDLVTAVRTVAAGELFECQPLEWSGSSNGSNEGDGWGAERIEQLSAREREVLALTAHGYSSKEIGQQLHISSKTVDTYRSRIMEKLGFSHRWELVRFALRAGLLRPV